MPSVIYVIMCFVYCTRAVELSQHTFPDDFLFGVATSAYQIEGAWNTAGKGKNIWDDYTHKSANTNGDISSNSYNQFKEDVQLIKELGANHYSFSLSWSRILPTGFAHIINRAATDYYNNLINELIKNEITPIVTLYHWDLPQSLQDLGGWPNEYMIEYFEAYANLAFENFGNRVKTWITFNDPNSICRAGYGSTTMAPGINISGVADYLCGHNILKAHAAAYKLYAEQYKESQNGSVGISINANWMEPTMNNTEDKEAANRALDFQMNWILNPIFGSGNYPKNMIMQIEKRSDEQGYTVSRLPEFTNEEIENLKNSADFLGISFYSALSVSHISLSDNPIITNTNYDTQVTYSAKHDWTSSCSSAVKVVPWAFRKSLQYLKRKYQLQKIMITGNGYPDSGELNDESRVLYHQLYLNELLEAMYKDKVNVIGYSVWTLMDNFDWIDGYKCRYGLYQVDFQDKNRARIPKSSTKMYKEIIKTRKLPKTSSPVTNSAMNTSCIWIYIVVMLSINYIS